MKSEEMSALMKGVGVVLREHMTPLVARLDALEKQQPDFKSMAEVETARVLPGMVERVQAFLAERLESAIKAIPVPKDGKDGADGKDGESIKAANVLAMVQEEVEKIPKPLDGKDGRNGLDGKDGEPGVNGKDGAPGLNGKDGLDGINGQDGRDGTDGEKGDKGQDGKNITIEDIRPILESEISKHVLELERRSYALVDRAIDRIPEPKQGKDGRDGADGLAPHHEFCAELIRCFEHAQGA